jgi:hypothetical protein
MVTEAEAKFIHDLYTATGGDASGSDAIVRFMKDYQAQTMKDQMPAGGRATTGYLYEGNSPFGLIATDPISQVISGGSPLMNWIPSRYINDRFEHVAHLEWVAPEGFDGSQTYAEWLRTIDIDECGGGPTTTWSGFAYHMQGGRFRWQTKMMKPYPDGGIKYYEGQPIYTLRGSNIGQPLSSDKEWAIARLMMAMQQHYDYVLKYGDRANSNMEWDGLDTILRSGYVQARLDGPGQPHWADPLIINGVGISDVGALLTTIRAAVRRQLTRLRMRNWTLNAGDMAIVMPAVMWDNIAEHVAAGGMYRFTNTYGFTGQVDMSAFIAEYNKVRTGGFGWGNIQVDGTTIPVIVDDNMGMNVTIDPGGENEAPGIAGDIWILVRRANGMTLLEQQFVDWTKLDYPTNGLENIVPMPQGHIRAGWVTEANACYYYYGEMAGRIVTYMQPLQTVIRNVVVETLDNMEAESGAFYSPNFYAFNGRTGGQGTQLLFPAG